MSQIAVVNIDVTVFYVARNEHSGVCPNVTNDCFAYEQHQNVE